MTCMSQPLPLTDFRALRLVLGSSHDSAPADEEPDPLPHDQIGEQTWHRLMTQPSNISIATSEYHGSMLAVQDDLRAAWWDAHLAIVDAPTDPILYREARRRSRHEVPLRRPASRRQDDCRAVEPGSRAAGREHRGQWGGPARIGSPRHAENRVSEPVDQWRTCHAGEGQYPRGRRHARLDVPDRLPRWRARHSRGRTGKDLHAVLHHEIARSGPGVRW